MNETIVMWAYVFVIALAALFFATKLIAEEYSNKLMVLLDKVLVLGLVAMFIWNIYTITTGSYQSYQNAGTDVGGVIEIMVIAMFLIIRKRFLHNLKEAGRIIKG